jgi:hypothetical protein
VTLLQAYRLRLVGTESHQISWYQGLDRRVSDMSMCHHVPVETERSLGRNSEPRSQTRKKKEDGNVSNHTD